MERNSVGRNLDMVLKMKKVLRAPLLTGLALFLPIMAVGAVLANLSPSYFEAEGKLMVKAWSENSPTENSGQKLASSPPLPQASSLATELEFITSSTIIARAIQDVQRQTQFDSRSREAVLQSLTLTPNESARTITVIYKDPVAVHGSLMVNTLMKTYQTQKKEINRSILTQSLANLKLRLPQAQKALQTSEKTFNQFQLKHQFQANTQPASSTAFQLEQAQEELNQIRAKTNAIDQARQNLIQELGISPTNALALVKVSQSKEFQQLFSQLRQMEEQLNQAQERYTEVHPAVVQLKRDIDALRERLNGEVKRVAGQKSLDLDVLLSDRSNQIVTDELVGLENQQKALDDQLQQLQARQTDLKKKAKTLPALIDQHQKLAKALARDQSNYQALLRQSQKFESALQENTQQIEILSLAVVPQNKISPYQRPIFWSAFGLGLGLGGVVSWIGWRRDRVLTSVEATKKHLGLKVLGIIPTFEQSNQDFLYDGDLQRIIPTIYPIDKPGSPTSESFRMLYLNLKVLPEFKTLSSIAVTSAVPQEGKSSIVANLATVIAQSGLRVLIVDTNLQYPFQKLIWNLSNNEGLSNVLMSQTSLLLSIRPISSNLDILTSGSIRKLAKNPFESRQMKLLVADLSSRYDLVIFDLPAINLSADAAIVSQLTDGVILVARPGYLNELNATKALTVLENSNTPVLGMVLNAIDDPKETFIPLHFDADIDQELFEEDIPEESVAAEAGIESVTSRIDASRIDDETSSSLKLADDDRNNLYRSRSQAPLQSMQDLEYELEQLQTQWSSSKHLISQKEEELIHICQAKQELQIKLNGVSQSSELSEKRVLDLESLQHQIQNAEERKQYLLENLQSLRSQLKSEQDLFYAHLQILQTRYGEKA